MYTSASPLICVAIANHRFLPSVGSLRLLKFLFYEIFAYLHSIQGSPLANLVACEPERIAILVGQILAYTAHVYVVFSGTFERHRVDVVLCIVFHGDARCRLEGSPDSLYRERLFGLEPHTLGVRTQRRHTHTGGTRANIAMHNLARLVKHLHLLLRITGLGHLVYLRNHIVGQLVGELFYSLHLARLYQFLILLLQLLHGCRARTAGTLVACHMHLANMAQLIDGLKHHHHHDSSAVRVGNNAAWALQGILGIQDRKSVV